jgi:hypothetical protein
LLVDWQLSETQSSDANELVASVDRAINRTGSLLERACTDRGFQSQANDQALKERGIGSRACSRKIEELRKQMEDSAFAASQKRSSQTEARVSIISRCIIAPLAGQRLRKSRASRALGRACAQPVGAIETAPEAGKRTARARESAK